ncbi:MAG: MFS transporter [Candidatus Nezhaarchaeales archaeon]
MREAPLSIDDKDAQINFNKRRYLFILLLTTSFLYFSFIARFGYGVLVPRLIDDLGFSRAEAGSIFSIYMIVYSIFSVITGRVFDRLGIRVVTVLSFIYGFGMVLASFSTSFLTLAVAFAIAGLGASSSWTPMVALVSSNLPKSWRGRSIGLLEVGIRISHGTAGLLIPTIALTVGWRTTWWILALPLFVYGLVFYKVSSKNLLQKNANRSENLVSYRALLASKKFWPIGLSYSFMSFASYIILTFLVDFLEREVRMSYIEASTMSSIMGFIGIAGALILTWASDRVGRITILVSGNAIAAVSAFMMSSLPSNTSPSSSTIIIIIIIYGIFFGALWPTYAACAGDVFPSSVGTVLGLWTLMMGLSALAAPIIGGFVADATGSYIKALQLSVMAYVIAMALVTTLTLKRDRVKIL